MTTNKRKYSVALVNAIENSSKDYMSTRGDTDYSCTQLIDSPTLRRMCVLCADDIIEDVDDLYFTIFGSILHKILEDSVDEEDLAEQRWFAEVLGKKISAMGDHLAGDGTLSDYKYTSVFKIKKGLGNVDWERQLNVLAYLARLDGYDVDKIQIIAYPKDWRKSESLRTQDYPGKETKIEFPLWTMKEAEKYIEERVELHMDMDEIDDPADLPICSQSDRWKDDDKWAVMKLDAKRANRVLESEEEAAAHMKGLEEKNPKDIYIIEFRKGTAKRCEEYCKARYVCPYSPHVEKENKLDAKLDAIIAKKAKTKKKKGKKK